MQTRNEELPQIKDRLESCTIPMGKTESGISEILEVIRTHGLVIFPSFLDHREVEVIRQEAEEAFKREPRVNYPFGRALRLGSPDSVMNKYPAVAQCFSRPIVSNLAAGYYEGPHVVNAEIHITHEFRTDRGLARNAYLHFDRLHSFKFLLYLTDVDEDCGAFSCVPGTNGVGRKLRESSWEKNDEYRNVENRVAMDHPELGIGETDAIPVTGGRGALIVFDTDTFHKGGEISPGRERMVIRGHCRRVGQAGGGGGDKHY